MRVRLQTALTPHGRKRRPSLWAVTAPSGLLMCSWDTPRLPPSSPPATEPKGPLSDDGGPLG